jgi:PKD repeat protein
MRPKSSGGAAVSYPSIRNETTSWFGLVAAFFAVIFLAGCLNGGGGGSNAGAAGGAPVVPPPVVVPNPITAFADAGGGNVTVTSANTLAPGAIIVISGTTSYNGTFTVVSATATDFTITAPFVADDATGVWIAGGGVIAGCTTTGATGVINLPVMTTVASRFTGVAPLSVFFDATATTGAVAQPFHEMLYSWNFGDPGSGTWAYGSRAGSSSRNAATGAVAAHVFETPGTYTVALSVTDGTNAVTNNCIQIAVQDPNVVYAGANTRCYTQGAVSAGACPGGGTEILNASADPRTIVSADLAAGKRLLFARGQTWTTLIGLVPLNVNGPWTIGAYGAGAKPVFRRGAGTVILNVGQVGSDWKDARVMDLQLEDDATNNVSCREWRRDFRPTDLSPHRR